MKLLLLFIAWCGLLVGCWLLAIVGAILLSPILWRRFAWVRATLFRLSRALGYRQVRPCNPFAA